MLLGSIGALAALTATVSLAWACVPGATLTLSPSSGPAGTRVQATMSAVPDETIELRWGSPTGQPLTSGPGPTFSFIVPPGTAPGTYSVFVWHAEHGHSVGSAPFQVRAATPPPPPPANPIAAPVGPVVPTPTQLAAARKRAALRKAVRKCNRKYKAKRSHSARKKRKLKRSRASCIRRAKKRYR